MKKATLESRVAALEAQHELDQRPNPIVIYDPAKPGDADQKAEQARQHGVIVPILIPNNGRDKDDKEQPVKTS